MRYAVYFTPGPEHRLTAAAEAWLGRSAFTGAAVTPPALAELPDADRETLTASARRYGFHGTLTAPFRLAADKTPEMLSAAADAFAAGCAPFFLPALMVSRLGAFRALTPAAPSAAMHALADSAVDAFAPFRAPPGEDEIRRRKPELLTERQRDYLHRYGYPYVKQEFRFHMTLTDPLTEAEAARFDAALASHFAPALVAPVAVEAISLFIEEQPGAAFTVHSTHRFATV